MSIASLAPDHTLNSCDERCACHEKAATFSVACDGADPIFACDICVATVLREAMFERPFPPPVVTAIDLDLYSNDGWGVA